MKSLGIAVRRSPAAYSLRILALTILALAALIWLSGRASAWFDGNVSAELRQAMTQTLQTGPDAALLKTLYSGESPSPHWLNDDGLTERGQQAIAVLHDAQGHGIHAGRYQVDEIESMVVNDTAPAQLAKADTLISISLLRMAQDLKAGIAEARWHDRLGTTEIRPDVAALWPALMQAESLEDYMQAQAPHHALYEKLQATLADYLALHERGGWPKLPAGASLKPGMTDSRVASLQQLLVLTGDLKEGAQPPAGNHYDGVLVEAVQHFQSRHGLKADGAIGPATLTALNTPIEQRIDQIRVTMDQLRQLPDSLGQKYILVNLPAFRLSAVEGGKEKMNMKVIVGQPRRPTPGFSNAITQAVFNPTWSVPTRIAREDFPGKLRANPNYLTQNGFSVYADGMRIDPSAVSADSVGAYTLQQASGGGNALGKVKFPIPDNQSVYLHDTNNRSLFAADYRALSSGCIRLEQPEALAKFVLNGNAGWDEPAIGQAYASRSHRTVEINPVPVHAVYWTAWVDESGTPHFYQDIYKRNGRILSTLDAAPKAGGTQLASR